MSAKRFFDTNVLVYACDSTDPAKQATALQLITEASAQGSGVLSVQVLGEFFHAVVIRSNLPSRAELVGDLGQRRFQFGQRAVQRVLQART